ncbi:MAG: response regulator [Nitrospirae bacterium]|nr:response regulator [Nitrospirota bacterium]
MKKLLIVDDNADIRRQVVDILHGAGYYVEDAANAKEAIDKTILNSYDVVLLDAIMPGMKGIEAIKEIKQLRPKTKIVIITAFATIENAIDSIKRGAVDYLPKPFKIEELLNTVKRELQESIFETQLETGNMDFVLNTISNPIRRKLIKLINQKSMRFMELNSELALVDHTRLVFHLKQLKKSGIITQNNQRAYVITDKGIRVYRSMMILETYLITNS